VQKVFFGVWKKNEFLPLLADKTFFNCRAEKKVKQIRKKQREETNLRQLYQVAMFFPSKGRSVETRVKGTSNRELLQLQEKKKKKGNDLEFSHFYC